MESKIPYEQAKTLIDAYRLTYERMYNAEPVLNIVSAKWAIADIIKEISYEETKALFAYFFKTTGSHDLSRFIYNYHDLLYMMRMQSNDEERRRRLRSLKLR